MLRILEGVGGDKIGARFSEDINRFKVLEFFALVFPYFPIIRHSSGKVFAPSSLLFFFHPASSEGCGTSVFLNRYLERYSERGGGRNVFLIKRYSASRLNETLLEA